MSHPWLPENPNDWPTDPFMILGVTRSASLEELRRAYTRLIRQYKPEQAPEQFRRIRSAYETLQRYAAWNEAVASDPARESKEQLERELEKRITPSAGTQPPQPDSPPRLTVEDCWRWALSGEMNRAYGGLCELQVLQPNQASLCLRLYWLLFVNPKLDAERAPRDWLVSGLLSCRKYDRLLQVYSGELLDDPSEVLRPRFERLLEQSQGTLRLELLERRWQALAKLELWAVANSDLDVWQERFCRDDEAAYLRLLLSMASKSFHVLPLSEYSVFHKCDHQIKALNHLSLTHPNLFDRAEFITRLANESTTLAPGPVRDVSIHFLAERTDEAAAAAEPFLSLVCQNPREGLELLDQAADVAPNMLHEFSRAIEWLSWNVRNERAPTLSDDLAEEVLYFFLDSLIECKSYQVARPDILQFCCDEGISPLQICQLLQAPQFAPNYLGFRITGDLSLRCTYEAFRLGWSI